MASCRVGPEHGSMGTESCGRAESPGAAALASLVPWAAFLVTATVVDPGREHGSLSLEGVVAAAPFYVLVVALPSMLPLLAARTGRRRLVLLIALTALAAVTAVLMVTSDDAQAGLAVLLVPYVAIPLAVVVWVGEVVVARRTPLVAAPPLAPATPSDRLAALAIDVAVLGAALFFPLNAMSRAKHEVAAGVLGVAVGTVYMATLVTVRRRTIGQSLLRLAVVDATTFERVPLPRAVLRSLIIVLEVATAATITFSLAAIAELVSVGATGRSLTDRLLRTAVVTDGTTT